MTSFFTILLIGISLSMDAFSLALIYGMIVLTHKQKIFLSIVVGIYHFFMPLIGLQFGTFISNIININLVASIILIYIGLDLFFSNNQETEKFKSSIISFLIFGLSVSIDSLSVGIGLKALTNNYLQSSIIFSITSLLFTYLGLILGNIISNKIGNHSKKIGGIILIIIAIITFIK